MKPEERAERAAKRVIGPVADEIRDAESEAVRRFVRERLARWNCNAHNVAGCETCAGDLLTPRSSARIS